ncbi:molybdenum cofactor biosynthesis protein MoaC [Gordonia effusa NBRC 100432]|uniref:Cyclic pyranopterin monophosphate synthase n=1 Tax=Gordonia effusa NBRC 100432 TaxID=1077974 RepID=H0QYW8_9ACTN|nr:bifunctional molybdenum cofactor biosynthesis protein MoaC/MoaB [Gordonia effusa]GAB18019.1 molybdenum cofactor biosynthesis protein MoaC [Gordonia effusa NBRC 100432]
MAADPIGSGESALSHVAADGSAHMVDVSHKDVTSRTATARGIFCTTPQVISLISSGDAPKGDVLAVARVAGIMGAKRTSDLIPLCHQLPLNSVNVDFELTDNAVVVTATASTTGRTGVEMEALTAVSITGLTLHDMVKAVDPSASMTDIALMAKDGGRHGCWRRDETPATAPSRTVAPGTVDVYPGRRATVVVSSTRIAGGERTDATGPVIREWLSGKGFDVGDPIVAADADIADAIRDALAQHPALLITTGGTGPTSDDHTPEATAPHLTTTLPGIAEAMRETGRAATPYSSLSRGLAGFAGRTLVVNLPGSKGGVKDGIAVLDPLVSHLFHLADGGGH